jgi:hypothetical protein
MEASCIFRLEIRLGFTLREHARSGCVEMRRGANNRGRHEQSEKYGKHRGPSYPPDAHSISYSVFRCDVRLRPGLLADVKWRMGDRSNVAARCGSRYGRPCRGRGSY